MGNDPTLIAWEGSAWGIPPKFNKINKKVTYFKERTYKMVSQVVVNYMVALVVGLSVISAIGLLYVVLRNKILCPVKVKANRIHNKDKRIKKWWS